MFSPYLLNYNPLLALLNQNYLKPVELSPLMALHRTFYPNLHIPIPSSSGVHREIPSMSKSSQLESKVISSCVNSAEKNESVENQEPSVSSDESPKIEIREKVPDWDEEDDKLLLQIGTQYKNDWKKVAKRLLSLRNKRKSTAFLKNRYRYVRDLSVQENKSRFSHEEDILLAKCIDKYGKNWTKISTFFTQRGPTKLKNRYYCFIRKKNLYEKFLSEAENINGNEVKPSENTSD